MADQVLEAKPAVDQRLPGASPFELFEVSDNLDRAELTIIERSEHEERWRALVAAKEQPRKDKEVSAHRAQKPPYEPKTKPTKAVPKEQHKPSGRPKGGASSLASKTGIERRRQARSTAIAGLPPEVKAKAAELGLENAHTALMSATKQSSVDEQFAVLLKEKEKRDASKAKSLTDKDIREDAATWVG